MTKIIIFNGPPRSGKDTAAKALQQYLGEDTAAHLKLSTPLKTLASDFIGQDSNVLEQQKEQPILFGISTSFRDIQIGLYSSIAKVLGPSWLAEIAAHKINKTEQPIVVLSDGGRPEEVDKLVRKFGAGNIMLFHIHRKNTSFQGDIRQYIYDGRIFTQLVINDDLQQFQTEIIDEVMTWLG